MALIQRTEEMILNQLIYNEDYYRKVYPHLNESYFQERVELLIFESIKEYVEKYSVPPSADTVSLLVNQKEGINGDEIDECNTYISELLTTPAKTEKLDFIVDQTESFCQEKSMYNSILDSMAIINGDDTKRDKNVIPELMKDALKISFTQNIGLDYSDPEERYDRLHSLNAKIPFDIKALNLITKGGLEDKTLNCVLASTGVGKSLRNGTPVITPQGTVNIEDLKIGDYVCGTEKFIKVLGVYPQGERDIYKVSFSDGTSLDVDGDHLWTLNHQNGNTYTKTTNEISRKYLRKDGGKLFSLPKYSPVDYNDKSFSIPVFLLGAWLGDGSSWYGIITMPENKVNPDRFGMEYKYINGKGEKCGRYSVYGLTEKLKESNLFRNKHIPEEYFFGSIQQRQDLLDGLLETDGNSQGMRGITFDNTNENLVDGVIRLARSLGYIAKLIKTKEYSYYRDKEGDKVICKPCYRCHIKHPEARTAKRYVSNIEHIGKDHATCIMVDAEDHLFLAGDFIPTHNTIFMCHCAAAALTQGKNVLYITMEMSEEKIAQRIDANLMDVELDDFDKMEKDSFLTKFKNVVKGNGFLSKMFGIKKKQKLGQLFVKEFPTGAGNANHFRFLLDELALKKGFKPDFIVIDYINICSSVRIVAGGNGGSYAYVKAIAEELRGLAVEYVVPILTGTQTNRAGFSNSDIEMTDTSECLDLYSIIESKKRGRIFINDVNVGEEIKDHNGWVKVRRKFSIKEKKCYRVTLKSGKQIICSGDHKFPSSKGVTCIKKGLSVGDKLASI